MANLQGIVVSSPIVPPNTDSLHPSHIDTYGKGGYRVVSSVNELSNIKTDRLSEGMLVGISGTNDIYTLKDNVWVRAIVTLNNNNLSGIHGIYGNSGIYNTGIFSHIILTSGDPFNNSQHPEIVFNNGIKLSILEDTIKFEGFDLYGELLTINKSGISTPNINNSQIHGGYF